MRPGVGHLDPVRVHRATRGSARGMLQGITPVGSGLGKGDPPQRVLEASLGAAAVPILALLLRRLRGGLPVVMRYHATASLPIRHGSGL